MILTTTWDLKLETVICASCGVIFAMTEDLVASRRKTGGNFYCPSGHVLNFPKPTQAKVKP